MLGSADGLDPVRDGAVNPYYALLTPPVSGSSVFGAIGRFSVRFAVPVIAFWLLGAFLSVHFLPSLSSVSQSQVAELLPHNAPSLEAVGLATPFQPADVTTSLMVAADRRGPLTSPDFAAITRIEAHLRTLPYVARVVDLGTSGDREADKALIETTIGAFGRDITAKKVVDEMRRTFTEVDPRLGMEFHLTGFFATAVDINQLSNSAQEEKRTEIFSIIFIIALVFFVFRAVLAPLVALAPAALALFIASPVVAQVAKWGFPVSDITQFLLIILVLGAGTDYGLFLIFRVREELGRGYDPREAVHVAFARVGESITFSASTVIAAFGTLLLANLALYRGLGMALALAILFVLLIDLTALPALLAIFGRAVFWPSVPKHGVTGDGWWGRIASKVTDHPLPTLVAGTAILSGLALVTVGYTGGFGNPTLGARADSALGAAVARSHFPSAGTDPTNVLFRFPVSVWEFPYVLAQAQEGLGRAGVFAAVTGALNPNGTALKPDELVSLHRQLGRADRLPVFAPTGTRVSGEQYEAYRATAQFISPDGRTVRYDTTLAAGPSYSDRAIGVVPEVRTAVDLVGHRTGAFASAVGGGPPQAYDLVHFSNDDLVRLVPLILLLIGLILVVLLRGIVAPLYLIGTVGLSYLAALGLDVLIFRVIGHNSVMNFVLPSVMFVFLMAIGEDYNILMMNRIREEARHVPLKEAVRRGMVKTGTTITSAGLILAGTFTVLTFAITGSARQIGVGVALGVLLDTFLVRTLLIPALVVLLGRWNWWPSLPESARNLRPGVAPDP